MESLGGDVFENLFLCVCVCACVCVSEWYEHFGVYVSVWHVCDMLTLPSAALLCAWHPSEYNYSSVPQHTRSDMFTVTLEWKTCTHAHMGVYCVFNTQQVLLCHLRFALHKDTNSRLTQTLKLLWRGLFLVLSLPLLNFLFLVSAPLKGIDALLPHSTGSKRRETWLIT